MEPEPQPQAPTEAPQQNSYESSWERFYERALDILVGEPVRGRFTIKYNQKTRMCTLKVTDGKRIVLKRTNNVKVLHPGSRRNCLALRNLRSSLCMPSPTRRRSSSRSKRSNITVRTKRRRIKRRRSDIIVGTSDIQLHSVCIF